jgi:methionyl aminopeptidase
MIAHTQTEIDMLRECGKRLARIRATTAAAVRPGISTGELDRMTEVAIREAGGAPVFKGYRAERGVPPFPGVICTSINDEIVHGIPSAERVLVEGDIIGLDFGMRWPAMGGLITDTATTVIVGANRNVDLLLRATREALDAGIRAVRPGARVGDIGAAIEARITKDGFGVVRELAGHGVGKKLHEAPYIPNYGTRGKGETIASGMVFAIEPMATAGNADIELDDDQWTWCTVDGSLAAHFEHTVLVTDDGVEVLTA